MDMPNTNQNNGHDARKPTEADRFVGQQMRQARRELGLTQDALASLLGVTFQQIQKYEAGHSRLSAGRLRDVAIALKKEIHYFYEPFAIDSPVSHDAEHRLRVQDLKRDGKRLIDQIDDALDLRAAVHILEALDKAG